MMRKFVIASLLLSLAACKTFENNNKKNLDSDLKTPSYVVKPSSYKPSVTLLFDLIHTKLDVAFDWPKSQLIGTAVLKLTPHAYAQESIDIDAKGFVISKVSLEKHITGREYNDIISFDYDGEKIHVNFSEPILVEDTIAISINYIAKPNELEEGGSKAISSDKGLYFINPNGTEPFVPKQLWTQGETQASSCWFPTLDAPNQKTTSEITITVENKYTTLSNGLLKESTLLENGYREDKWIQDKKHAPYLVMMAVGEFSVYKDSWNGKEVNYYTEPEYANTVQKVFGNTPEMLTFYSNLLSVPYPWDKYSQIVIRDYVSGAMENTSAVTFLELLNCDSIEVNDRNWDFIIAHELFHHWFGDLVTCESWANLSLNESFANYSEYLWINHKYGKEKAEQHIAADLNNYLLESRSKRVPIIRYHYNHREDMFDRHSYEKGALVLHMLRHHLGDKVFFKSLNKYLTDKKFGAAEIHDLRMIFEETSGQDLNWFFNQWFMSAGHPDLEVIGEFNETNLELKISQKQDLNVNPKYKLPLEILVKTSKKERKFKYWITTQDTLIAIPLNNESLESYIVDPEYVLLADITELKPQSVLINELKLDYSCHSVSRAISSLFPANKVINEEQKKLAIHLLDSKYDNIKLSAIQMLNQYKRDNATTALLITHVKKQKDPLVLRSIFNYLADSSSNTLQSFFITNLEIESYLVKSELVTAIEDPDVIDSLFQVHKSYANYYLSKSFIEYFTKNNIVGKFEWIMEAYEKQKLRRKSYFVPTVIQYILKQDQEIRGKAKKYFTKRCLESTIESTKTSSFKALCLLNKGCDTSDSRVEILEEEKSKKQKEKYLEVQLSYLKIK